MNEKKQELLKQLWALEKANPTKRISTPVDILPLVRGQGNKEQEEFVVISLSGSHEVIRKRIVTKGLLNKTVVHPREVFRGAIKDNACAIIAVHNHPSGNLEPSSEDDTVTKKLKDAGEIIGIQLLDHIIVSKKGFYSYLEHDKL